MHTVLLFLVITAVLCKANDNLTVQLSPCSLLSDGTNACRAGLQCIPATVLSPVLSGGLCMPCRLGEYCPAHSINTNYSLYTSLCRQGAYCPQPSLQLVCPPGSFCTNSTYTPFPCTRQGMFCPANSSFPVSCPQGNYCPTPSQILPCPKGNYCRRGVVVPTRCPLLGTCPAQSSTPNETLLLVTLLLSLFALLLCLYLWMRAHTRREEQAQDTLYRIERSYSQRLQKLGYAPVEMRAGAFDALSGNISRLSIEFAHLGCELESNGQRILSGVSGVFSHSSLNAVMGPSGSGKSTLLDVIRSAAPSHGKMWFNGVEACPELMARYRKQIAFVPQDDVCHTHLTVFENIKYSVQLRQHRELDEQHKADIVNEILELLDLKDVQNTVVGSVEHRGISGGQRKRVNIGMELCTCPDVLFLDEPTSGLDSASTLQIIKALRRMTRLGMNVVAVVHQPRHQLFKYFDSVLLLGPGGSPVYSGPRAGVLGYFQGLGFVKEPEENTADFILDAVAGLVSSERLRGVDLEDEWARISGEEIMREKLPLLDLQIAADAAAAEEKGKQLLDIKVRIVPTRLGQFITFCKRDCRLLVRAVQTHLYDLLLLLAAAILVGIVYGKEWNVSQFPMMATLATLSLGLIATVIGTRPLSTERLVFRREADAGVSTCAYFAAKALTQLVQLFSHSFCFALVVYALTFPQQRFFSQWLPIFALAYWAGSGLGMALSVLLDPHTALLAAVLIPMILGGFFSGTFPALNTMGAFPKLIADFSFTRWAAEALSIQEERARPQYQPSEAYFFANGFRSDYFWNDVTVLLVMGTLLRLLALLCLTHFRQSMCVRSIARQLVQGRWAIATHSVCVCFTILSVEMGLKLDAWSGWVHLSWFQTLVPLLGLSVVYLAVALAHCYAALCMDQQQQLSGIWIQLLVWVRNRYPLLFPIVTLSEVSLFLVPFMLVARLQTPHSVPWSAVFVPLCFWVCIRLSILLPTSIGTTDMLLLLMDTLCIALSSSLVWAKQTHSLSGHTPWVAVLWPLLLPQIHLLWLYLNQLDTQRAFCRKPRVRRILVRTCAIFVFAGALVSQLCLALWSDHHLHLPLKIVFLPYWASLCLSLCIHWALTCLSSEDE